ncbi:MAG: hypothetical protein ACRC1K_13365, partial [Planctomycetia bacterium]
GLPANSGGLGRRGSQKTCIFMTDGVPNARADGSFVSSSNGQSYYHSFSGADGLGNGNAAAIDPAVALVTQICALESAGGFSAPSRKAKVHAIAFGDLFSTSTANAVSAKTFLQRVEVAGLTAKTSELPSYKIITGTADQRITRLQEAFTKIMQDGIQCTLIE